MGWQEKIAKRVVLKTAYVKAVRILEKFKLKELKMATYTCKYCGYQANNPMNANFHCNSSPHKKHEWMNVTEKLDKYTCKYCGYQDSNARTVSNYCNSSPNKKHEWLG